MQDPNLKTPKRKIPEKVGRIVGVVLLAIVAILVIIALFAWWLDDVAYRVVLASGFVAAFAIAAGFALSSDDFGLGKKRIGSGFSPTAPLLVPLFTLAVLVMKYGPVGEAEFTNRKLLLTAAAVATASWFVFAVWRGTQSTPRGVAPELYDSLKTEYLALRAAIFPKADVQVTPPAADAKAILPAVSDGPLPQDAIPGYLYALGKEIRFEEAVLPDGMTPSPRSWNIGSAYLQAQRKLAYVRDSLIAHESEKGVLQAHAFNLELRLTGSNLPEATRIQLSDQLKAAKKLIETGTNPGAHARSLYMIAAALSSYVYSRQKALLQMQSQQHWLVVVVQVIAAVILSIAVLAGSTAEAIAAGVLFFMVAAGSGILSLLHVRQSVQSAEYGDDYGLFRIEMARAFTLSGMAGLIAVFLIANLPILAGAGVFDPPPVTDAPGTPPTTEVSTAPGGTPTGPKRCPPGPHHLPRRKRPSSSPVAPRRALRRRFRPAR